MYIIYIYQLYHLYKYIPPNLKWKNYKKNPTPTRTSPELLELDPKCQFWELISTCNQQGPGLLCQKALVVKLSNKLPIWPEISVKWKKIRARKRTETTAG